MSSQRWWRRAAVSLVAFLCVVAWAPAASADRTVTANEPIQWFDDVRNRFQDLVFPSYGGDGSGEGNGNNGHGNNDDGVDSSNPGNSGGEDASCDGSGECVDDEGGGGGGAAGNGGGNGGGNGNGKNK